MATLSEVVSKLRSIKNKGFVETHRKGNTGIGKTLEDLLGIEENNIAGPDIAETEIKSVRKNSDNRVTLFTKEPPRNKRPLWGSEMIYQLGYEDQKGRQALNTTIQPNQVNVRGFSLGYGEGFVKVIHEDRGCCAKYPLDLLKETFVNKLGRVIIVFATVDESSGREKFYYDEAYLLRGFNKKSFVNLMRDGEVILDLRMRMNSSGNRIRNRGSAWRVLKESRLDEVYDERKSLL
jgi:hypothetical protein